MRYLLKDSLLETVHSPQQDHEVEILADLYRAACESGIDLDQTAITNFYFALKSKPLAILTGPKQTGKIELIHQLAKVLTENDHYQYQMMPGHPWSFEKSENAGLLIEAQMRFNTDKLISMVEDAINPGNSRRVFIACITRISPAELLSFFTEVALQISKGKFEHLGNVNFPEPVSFPPNFFLIGTMDTVSFDWWDNDLLSKTSIIPFAGSTRSANRANVEIFPFDECVFLRSCVRNKQSAYGKVHAILKPLQQPLKPLLMIESLLTAYGRAISNQIIEDAIVYLANSWSRLGRGLFNPDISKNLAIALDLVISQIFLPRAAESLYLYSSLRGQFLSLFDQHFPRSFEFVTAAS